jgi:hypothetical protein
LQTSIMLPLVLSDIFYPAQFGSPSLRVTIRHPRSNYALRRIPFRRKSTKVHLSRACVRAGTATGRGISPRREVCRFACG